MQPQDELQVPHPMTGTESGEDAGQRAWGAADERQWMAGVVLMAKSTYVWLEQLARKYQRPVRTLADIPNEELDRLATRGINALWLVGLWERSAASQRIKHRMGQTDAGASAYAVFEYEIASDLGGWSALNDLRGRAEARGLRLSADMVANHVGIDARWVIEHPDWFVQLDRPPFPTYSFNSENLADDERVGVHLEDHYYEKSDAAVVFERRDLLTGDRRYLYHGNDGTLVPWNDTAQLDYSRADVREAVIQTILHVARNFDIIRFDAAMTLTKEHIQRLWFPPSGETRGIPSRAEHGMTRAEFEVAIPNEFWREVVRRVGAEAPDTLLVAEAFWMLEGYFVRTLGMHRVYNSAFMQMLRDEETGQYRRLIRETMQADARTLGRLVNYMSNPDEPPAIEQFGDGERYLGVCTVMVTVPGMPMFAHGQLEGLRERYGMEFHRPRLDEAADEALVDAHEQRIFPLLRKRELFARGEQFHLFDLRRKGGTVNENVLAFSNRHEGERALVIFNNKDGRTRGWLRDATAARAGGSGGLVRRSLGEALDLPRTGFAVFKDYATRLEHVRDCAKLWQDGMQCELGAYEHHAFLDWRFEKGEDWARLCRALRGTGVASVLSLWQELGASPGRPRSLRVATPVTKGRARGEAKKNTSKAKKSTKRKTRIVKRAVNGRPKSRTVGRGKAVAHRGQKKGG